MVEEWQQMVKVKIHETGKIERSKQDMEDAMAGHTVEFSRTEQVHVVSPGELNGSYRLFGGALLQRIDEVAAVVAQRHCQSYSVTTAAIDNLNFKSGAYAGDLLVLIGYVTYTGNTSLEVRIDTYVENRQRVRRPINRAFFVMVAMDENDKPTKVPPLIVETISQQAEWEAALLRKKNRQERRKEGY